MPPKQNRTVGHSLFAPFAQFAEPMTAALADLRELTCQPSAFAAFQQGHFLSAFAVTVISPLVCRVDTVAVLRDGFADRNRL